MVDVETREMTFVKRAAARLFSLGKSIDVKDQAAVAKLVRSGNRFSRTLNERLEVSKTLKLWRVVMLVTCVEAYLQDLLAAAATV
ncbi:MAG TPA: hypothetical protein VF515_16600, partial [Candidatus Binatia bacterium]